MKIELTKEEIEYLIEALELLEAKYDGQVGILKKIEEIKEKLGE